MTYLIVGEAYGEEEEREGRPFVGRSGGLLTKILETVGIDRATQCEITNVVCERPPENNFGIYYLDKSRKKPSEDLLRHYQLLNETIRRSNPRCIITLGGEALKAVTGKTGTESWRGSILRHEETGIPVVPTIHPAAILRGGGTGFWYYPAAVHDVERAKLVAERGLQAKDIQVEVTSDPERLKTFLDDVKGFPVAVDIETAYKHRGEEVTCVGFSADGSNSLVFPLVDGNGGYMVSPESMERFGEVLSEFFSGDWKKVGQNIQFDINVLRRIGLIREVRNIWMDTLVAHANCIQPEFPHDLAFLASWYTCVPYYKMDRGSSGETLWQYNGRDAAVTLQVSQALVVEIGKLGLTDFYFKYINRLVPVYADITLRGIKIDKVYQKELKEELKDGIRTAKTDLDTVTEGKIENHRSPKQVATYLYKTKEYKPVTKKGKITTDEEALKKLARRYPEEKAIAILLQLRELEKLLGTYANLKTDDNDCVRTMYLFAKTGRLRSGRFEK